MQMIQVQCHYILSKVHLNARKIVRINKSLRFKVKTIKSIIPQDSALGNFCPLSGPESRQSRLAGLPGQWWDRT